MVNSNARSRRCAAVALLLLLGGTSALPALRAANDSAASANLRHQEIHFDPPQDRVIDGSLLPLMATATSGLKIRFVVVSGPAQVVGSQLMLTGPGEVVIRATQPGDATHAAAAPIEHSFKALAPNTEAANSAPAAVDAPASAAASTEEPAPAQPEQPPQPVASSTAASNGVPELPPAVSELIPKALINAANGKMGPAAANQLPAKLTLTLPGNVEMIFVRVPAGQAVLGSLPGETGHQQNESQHAYRETQGFLMSATEVTQAQFEALTGQRPSYFRSEWQSRPVEQIRWSDVAQDASGFFDHLNQLLQSSGHANFAAALPSDDQWEYACRAGTRTTYNNRTELSFPINESNLREIATFDASETSNVATHSPNSWGLYDMHGNVAEWTREGSLRGGSFRDSPAYIRSASKQFGRAGSSDLNREAGFRVILVQGSPGVDTQ